MPFTRAKKVLLAKQRKYLWLYYWSQESIFGCITGAKKVSLAVLPEPRKYLWLFYWSLESIFGCITPSNYSRCADDVIFFKIVLAAIMVGLIS